MFNVGIIAKSPLVVIDETALAIWNKLIAWWEYEDATTSTTLADSHSTNTLTAGPSTIANRIDSTDPKLGAQSLKAQTNTTLSVYIPRSNTTFDFGDVDFSMVSWIRRDASNASIVPVLARWNAATSDRSYGWFVSGSGDGYDLRFYVSSAGSAANAFAEVASALNTEDEWGFYYAEHDATADEVATSKNAGTLFTAAFSGGPYQGSSANFSFNTSYDSDAPNIAAGVSNTSFDGTAVFDERLTQTEIEWLYNSGSGRTYQQLQDASGN